MLREYVDRHEAAILALNERFVEVLSPMDPGRFVELRQQCAFLRVAEIDGSVAGFIMAFAPESGYDSPNYGWFGENLEDFLYIDRVVVSSKFQGGGVGSELYSAARHWADTADFRYLAAEIYVEPPNQSSLRFHEKMGFREMATRRTGQGNVVSLQCLEIG